MRILIAINEDNGIDSLLSEHFGHCPYFAIYNTEKKELKIIKNKLTHSNTTLTPVDQILKFNPDIIFSKGMGRKAIKLFNEKNIDIQTGNYKTIKEIINNLNHLEKLDKEYAH
jgi:predicted Fe-Mo cluster-binding NifX family protein